MRSQRQARIVEYSTGPALLAANARNRFFYWAVVALPSTRNASIQTQSPPDLDAFCPNTWIVNVCVPLGKPVTPQTGRCHISSVAPFPHG